MTYVSAFEVKEGTMRFLFKLIAVSLLVTPLAYADTLTGTYQTEKSEEGNYLHVKFGACSNDKSLTCGTIKSSFSKGGKKNKSSKIVGDLIVWDMVSQGDGNYGNGKIWDPSSNNEDGSKKIYSSKMSQSGNKLSVSGCILIFCKAQDWTKVK